jgi:hypothetical protein
MTQAKQNMVNFNIGNIPVSTHPAAIEAVVQTAKETPDKKRLMQLVLAHHPASCRSINRNKH